MKKVTPKTLAWLVPATSIILFASLTYATSRPDDDKSKNKNSEKVLKKAKFAYENDIDTYLSSIRSFMLVPPRDGRFGASRVPTLHGSAPSKIPGYDKVNELTEKDYSLSSFVAGRMPQSYLKGYEGAVKNGQMKESDIPKYRITSVHRLIQMHRPHEQSAVKAYQKKFGELSNAIYHETVAVEDLCLKEGYDTFSDSFKVDGKEAWVMAKSVHATDKSCYSCHTDIKEGQPIGYVIAFLMKNQP